MSKRLYTVKRHAPSATVETAHDTYADAWRAYEAARLTAQGGAGETPAYRVELWRVRGGKCVAYTAVDKRSTQEQ